MATRVYIEICTVTLLLACSVCASQLIQDKKGTIDLNGPLEIQNLTPVHLVISQHYDRDLSRQDEEFMDLTSPSFDDHLVQFSSRQGEEIEPDVPQYRERGIYLPRKQRPEGPYTRPGDRGRRNGYPVGPNGYFGRPPTKHHGRLPTQHHGPPNHHYKPKPKKPHYVKYWEQNKVPHGHGPHPKRRSGWTVVNHPGLLSPAYWTDLAERLADGIGFLPEYGHQKDDDHKHGKHKFKGITLHNGFFTEVL